MPAFIMLTRVSPEALRSPKGVEVLERVAMTAVRAECPGVEWLASHAILGLYDYLDIFSAPDIETAAKVATQVRIAGRAHTEVWPATERTRYKEMVRQLPEIGTVMIAVSG